MKLVLRLAAVLVLASLVLAAEADEIERKKFRLPKEATETVAVQLNRPGELQVHVLMKGSLRSLPVRITLRGPGGVEVHKQGAAPLKLHYTLNNPERLGTWQVDVTNHAKMALLEGEVRLDFEPAAAAPPPSQAAPAPARAAAPADVTDGTVRTADDRSYIRAACQGRNDDVHLKLNMHAGTGTYFMSYQPVFQLRASYRSESLVELDGGASPILLDLGEKAIVVGDAKKDVFCKVRIYYGERD